MKAITYNFRLIGVVLTNHILSVYIAFLLIFVVHFLLYDTPLGLTFRSIGNNREADRSAEVNVNR